MAKVWLWLVVLMIPTVVWAVPQSITITMVDVPGCGPQTVFVSGTTTYGNDTACTRVYSQPEGQGFYNLRHTDCSAPTQWTVPLQFDPGTYRVRARVATVNNFNAVWVDSPLFTVPECACQ